MDGKGLLGAKDKQNIIEFCTDFGLTLFKREGPQSTSPLPTHAGRNWLPLWRPWNETCICGQTHNPFETLSSEKAVETRTAEVSWSRSGPASHHPRLCFPDLARSHGVDLALRCIGGRTHSGVEPEEG
ncbi:hypothetical protein AC578_9667 [Pseudocercospora eumusae]|uniref:Uncharacterized protein n=1 Tax=Pseudocercospora eumusae TaxID=321146 RepID=A0A139HQV7_9PEZI|nr:hypothetical protein AC578_9667 [Pseudocercospora eumusae]